MARTEVSAKSTRRRTPGVRCLDDEPVSVPQRRRVSQLDLDVNGQRLAIQKSHREMRHGSGDTRTPLSWSTPAGASKARIASLPDLLSRNTVAHSLRTSSPKKLSSSSSPPLNPLATL